MSRLLFQWKCYWPLLCDENLHIAQKIHSFQIMKLAYPTLNIGISNWKWKHLPFKTWNIYDRTCCFSISEKQIKNGNLEWMTHFLKSWTLKSVLRMYLMPFDHELLRNEEALKTCIKFSLVLELSNNYPWAFFSIGFDVLDQNGLRTF